MNDLCPVCGAYWRCEHKPPEEPAGRRRGSLYLVGDRGPECVVPVGSEYEELDPQTATDPA